MNKSNDKVVCYMAYAAVTAAICVVLTMMFAPISFGPVQLRTSETLCTLPFFTPATVPGLFLGYLLSNLLYGTAALDVVFGSLATLIGAVGSYALRRNKWAVCVPPILTNTMIVPWVLRYAYDSPDLIPVAMVAVGVGEILAVGVLGDLLLVTLERYKYVIFRNHMA